MPSLDVFKADAFSMISLTAAINALPYQPKMLGSMGLFTPKPILTTTAIVEKKEGKLSVLATQPRGTMPSTDSQRQRKVRNFTVPHIPHNRTIKADDVQNVRAFGSETETETVSQLVNDALGEMRADHETTFEWHRLGAIQGNILDSDGSTVIYNLFTEFGETEVTVDFALDTATTDIKGKCTAVIRSVETALGSDTYGDIVVFCGDAFWDALIVHPNVVSAYQNWNAATQMSTQQRKGFPFCGLTFKNYRGSIGGSAWLNTDQARVVPTGVQDLFQHVMAPGDMIDTVNTRGQMMYAKQELLPFGKGVQIHTQSNPLMLCTRPACLVKLTRT